MTAWLALCVAAVFGAGVVVGMIAEGIRKGGTLDLRDELALLKPIPTSAFVDGVYVVPGRRRFP